MKVDDFYYFYDLYDMDILRIYVNKVTNTLDIVLSMPVKMDYIANGCRSDFDYSKIHTFSFEQYECENNLDLSGNLILSKYELNNHVITLIINNKTIIIK